MAEPTSVAIAGGGIGGLAAALALACLKTRTHVYEQSAVFSEAGAGVGLGPNVVRIFQHWGLSKTLRDAACCPEFLLARIADDGRIAGCLPMGQSFIDKYGFAYLTIHRSELHQLLLHTLQQHDVAELHLNHCLTRVQQTANGVQLGFNDTPSKVEVQALIGADGLHSAVRAQCFHNDELLATGHWAYRAVLPMKHLPVVWRKSQIGIWLGKRLHVVHYPIQGGEALNLVVLVESADKQSLAGWDVLRSEDQIRSDLLEATLVCCAELQDLIRMVPDWRAWCLFDRTPLQQASQMAQARVALLGDAAHPMLPYLAQGAGMAIEDAQSFALHWQRTDASVEERLLQYAQARWPRVSRVQQRARRNGRIFHADGLLRIARDAALKLGGSRLMDMPWLYAG